MGLPSYGPAIVHRLTREAISATSPIPIALGENEYTRYGFRDIIEHSAASILNPCAQFVGGVTEFMKVAALAQAHDLPVAPHSNPELHVHLAAAAPNAIVEIARLMATRSGTASFNVESSSPTDT